MGISMIRPAYAGNAIRIYLDIPSGVDRWRLLRRTDDAFTCHDDPSAVPVYDGADEECILDVNFLTNGITYHYCLFLRVNGEWVKDTVRSAVSQNRAIDGGEDPQMFMRDRLDYGLNELVKAGRLTHPNGRIPVLVAPPTFDGTTFPVVVVQFNTGSSQEYGIGNSFGQDLVDDEARWQVSEGWLSRVQLSITAWSLNQDERIQLRRAVEFIILSNLQVFERYGMQNMEIQQNDAEDYHSYNAPVYQSITTATCLSSRYVGHTEERIKDVSLGIDY